jgi:hypothetical protein
MSRGEYILIEDSSTVDFHGLEAATGLEPIGESYTRGLWMHSTLVVRTDQAGQQEEVLGFLGQQLWARPLERPAKRRKSNGRGKESNHARQSREDRESRKWGIQVTPVSRWPQLDGRCWTLESPG